MKSALQKRWIGRWVIAVAFIHMAFTPVLYLKEISAWLAGNGPVELAPFQQDAGNWFFMFGLPLLLAGYLIDWMEKQRIGGYPAGLALLLAITTGIGIALYPESGFYLLIPAIVALWLRRDTGQALPA
ncbi:DUF6463 family protein [Aestuariispira insulae]|uniref:Uncharacterized protein n=1 Tax=Aestuariispira insulae TaxID=1461337 RepID=A0A3D9HFW4_9PROT|nr:DUF6463 family protein [Aestuariispira insulae]RED48151.1 hypothetical protein DFP90_108170 [Aestuariispira insulae]